MEGVIALLVLGLIGLLVVAPVLAILAMSRAGRLERRLEALEKRHERLEKAQADWVASEAPRTRAAAAASATPVARPAVVAPVEPAVPPVAPVTAPATPPVAPIAPPVPPAASTAEPPRLPSEPLRPSAEPPRTVAAPRPAASGYVGPLAAPRPASRPPGAPPRTTPPAAPPPTPPAPAIDWESILGLKGAAWLGGITLVIASLFFAKWAIDRGLITPELRLATMILVGVAGLAWAEVSLRRGYTAAAHAASGAGIAILYVAFYAGHALYGLFPLWLTFAMMALTTAVAGLLAIRYDALFTAVLGLLGGFATPVALSTGVDRPLGLFSYLLLLDVGLATVAVRKRWHALVLLGLAGTFLLELGWFFTYMSPAKMVIGLIAFGTFGLLFLLLPVVTERDEDATLNVTGALGALVPFLFALLIAPRAAFAGEWPLLFGFVALLDAALLAVAIRRERIPLLLGGALATALVLPMWAANGLERGGLWGPTLAAIALAVLLNAGPRIATWWRGPDDAREQGLAAAGWFGFAGLAIFAAVLVGRDLGDVTAPFLTAVLALALLLVERNAKAPWPAAPMVGAAAVAALVQFWFHVHTDPEHVLRDLAPGLLLVGLLATAAALRARSTDDTLEDEVGVLVANGIAIFGLFGCLSSAARGREPLPIFAALAIAMAFLVHSMWRRGWAFLAPIGLAVSALIAICWQLEYFQPADLGLVLPVYVLFALAFLAVPFALTGNRWRDRPELWTTSALALPAFFLPVHQAYVAVWGKGAVGLVPVAMAAVAVAALALVARRFPSSNDASAAALRLRYLAIYASVALAFLALAVPLQLDRQWITVGWAVLAAAICYLYGRLPHPGLKWFAAGLFSAVFVRLALNPEVFRYQARGLPIVNWLLYTYGVPTLCTFLGAFWLKRAAAARGEEPSLSGLPESVSLTSFFSLLGIILGFALINVEIVDFFSPGQYMAYDLVRPLARDLTMSVAWALYAILLLVIGIWRRVKPLRLVALVFLALATFKVFFYDLSALEGIYRVLSLVALAFSLFAVSVLVQRFVFGRDRANP